MTSKVPLERVHPNPANIRAELRDLDDLTESVRRIGVLQPILVTPAPDGRLVILDGHRRYEAATRAGCKTIPVIARRVRDDADHVLVMLAAGLHDQLTPLEEARAYASLKDRGLAFSDIARRTGRSAGTVRDRLALLRLPEAAQQMLADGRLTLTAATEVARSTGTGTSAAVATKATRPAWLTKSHRLAGRVRELCTHRDTRQVVGGVGCGQCWEQAIQTDATGAPK